MTSSNSKSLQLRVAYFADKMKSILPEESALLEEVKIVVRDAATEGANKKEVNARCNEMHRLALMLQPKNQISGRIKEEVARQLEITNVTYKFMTTIGSVLLTLVIGIKLLDVFGAENWSAQMEKKLDEAKKRYHENEVSLGEILREANLKNDKTRTELESLTANALAAAKEDVVRSINSIQTDISKELNKLLSSSKVTLKKKLASSVKEYSDVIDKKVVEFSSHIEMLTSSLPATVSDFESRIEKMKQQSNANDNILASSLKKCSDDVDKKVAEFSSHADMLTSTLLGKVSAFESKIEKMEQRSIANEKILKELDRSWQTLSTNSRTGQIVQMFVFGSSTQKMLAATSMFSAFVVAIFGIRAISLTVQERQEPNLAVQVYKWLVTNSNSEDFAFEYSRSLLSRGVLLKGKRKWKLALKDFADAIEAVEPLPENKPIQKLKANLHFNSGGALLNQGRREDALKNYAESVRLWQLTKDDQESIVGFADAVEKLATAYALEGDFSNCLICLRKVHTQIAKLSQEPPDARARHARNLELLLMMLAAHPDVAFHNADEAVIVSKNLEVFLKETTVFTFDSSALAYALKGDFKTAIANNEAALKRTRWWEWRSRQRLRQRAKLFEKNLPYRMTLSELIREIKEVHNAI